MTLIRILLLAALLAGCATPANNVRFYTLAESSPAKIQAQKSDATALMAIEILPIKVPERLKRPQIVITSKNSAQLNILEQDRWSSSFNDELQDAFSSGLSQHLNAVDISRGGRAAANQPAYRIAIVLQQFSAAPGEQVQVDFGWTVTRLNTNVRENKTLSCQATFSKPVERGINEVVKGIQATVADVTNSISASVKSLNNAEAGKCN